MKINILFITVYVNLFGEPQDFDKSIGLEQANKGPDCCVKTWMICEVQDTDGAGE
jgi:hypothetical protein